MSSVPPRDSALLMLFGGTRDTTSDILDCLAVHCPIKQEVGRDIMYTVTLSGAMFLCKC
jgi:hypothetical protein